MLREQPLVAAAIGLASGAAIASLSPTADFETRALRPARDAIVGAVGAAKEGVVEAAAEAGQRLKAGAAERGFSPEGLRELAQDVTDAFTDKAAIKRNAPPSSMGPSNVAKVENE